MDITTNQPAVSNHKLDFLLAELDNQIASFEVRRRRNKRRAFLLKIAITASSVAVTILLGIDTGNAYTTFLKNAALISGGIGSILGAWDAFFNHKELWIRYKRTANDLKGLRAVVQYRSKSVVPLSEEEVDDLFEQFQNILRQTNSAWLELHQPKPEHSAAPQGAQTQEHVSPIRPHGSDA
jgi:hypothetical protein